MASVRTLVRIKWRREYHPASTILHGLSEDEADALAPHVERLAAGEAVGAPGKPAEVAEPLPSPVVAAGPHAPTEGNGGTISDGDSRVERIASAIDILDEGDFTAKGRPKVPALADVLGFQPTAVEVTLALALRENLGQ